MSMTYLTTEELSERIKYNARTIRNDLKDSVLLEGRHYIRPFGQRKILFIWENIEEDMHKFSESSPFGSSICSEWAATTSSIQGLFN
ncbi:hypothetical protein CYQ88_10925 [Hydrogenovibrio sp. SC-1]|uniref:hypothetical protein n=1 Tax=Hydrogenovibrio sp. SC-1 TaxID=2065820 RepID=UPI000C7D9C88|nr:hypothetical protein [Hydrogenovibrio sp. SC-1]PLA73489.1 hypothetical protein CYQ88_10925 [Hydrogenovibrio sp. SC-1]